MKFRLAIASALVTVAIGGAALAEETPRYFDDGAVHFEVDPRVTVVTNRVHAAEGPVDVITVRPVDALSGLPTGASFVSITVFHASIDAAGDPATVARDVILDGALSAMANSDAPREARAIELAGHPVDGLRVSLGSGVSATVGAVAEGETVVVYYDQRAGADHAFFSALDTVGPSLAFGPAPHPAADDRDAMVGEHADDGAHE